MNRHPHMTYLHLSVHLLHQQNKRLSTSHFLQTILFTNQVRSADYISPWWTFCTITFVINIFQRHTIVFPSVTAVYSCIAHSGDIVKAKMYSALYIQWSCSLKSDSNSLYQSLFSSLPKIVIFFSLNHRILQLRVTKFPLKRQFDHTMSVHGVDTIGTSSLSCYKWSAILQAVGSNCIESVTVNCRDQAMRQTCHSYELLKLSGKIRRNENL